MNSHIKTILTILGIALWIGSFVWSPILGFLPIILSFAFLVYMLIYHAYEDSK